jgi:ribosomal protein S15P/S13E
VNNDAMWMSAMKLATEVPWSIGRAHDDLVASDRALAVAALDAVVVDLELLTKRVVALRVHVERGTP